MEQQSLPSFERCSLSAGRTVWPGQTTSVDLLLFRFEYIFAGSSPTLCKMNGYTFFGPLLYNLSYCRWYLEALFEKEANRYPDVLAPYVHRLSTRNGYTLNNYSTCVVVLFAMGFAYRALALLFMLFTNRGKQQWIQFTKFVLMWFNL